MFEKQETYLRFGMSQLSAISIAALGILAAGILLRGAKYTGKSMFPVISIASLIAIVGSLAYARHRMLKNWDELDTLLALHEEQAVRTDEQYQLAQKLLDKLRTPLITRLAIEATQNKSISAYYELAKTYLGYEVIKQGMSLSRFINSLCR